MKMRRSCLWGQCHDEHGRKAKSARIREFRRNSFENVPLTCENEMKNERQGLGAGELIFLPASEPFILVT